MESLEPLLARHPFFDGIEPRLLALVTGCASNVRFDPGAYLFREGGEANRFFLLREGSMTIELSRLGRPPVTLQTKAAGDIVGWSWLVPPYRWHFDGRALEPVRALAIDGQCLRNKFEADHDLGYELFKRFAFVMERQLQATRLQLLDVYGEG
jgi:CRP-like cAMP-binding protein